MGCLPQRAPELGGMVLLSAPSEERTPDHNSSSFSPAPELSCPQGPQRTPQVQNRVREGGFVSYVLERDHSHTHEEHRKSSAVSRRGRPKLGRSQRSRQGPTCWPKAQTHPLSVYISFSNSLPVSQRQLRFFGCSCKV
ncbi:hypothetical protein Q8A67_024268 [Cirrhinus molitorella]|uniref:Uncharacterized protein n=1 Tax=Cirrhinus molitorella TaxID=172907 RepID=A0AA88P3X8_9TELE|nr:hypothetical protein Q8A67_024268 [Cirrhinus molitorella]